MHDHDHEHDHALSFDRRTFLAATSALSLFAMNDTATAQQPAAGKGAPDKRLRQILAEFVVGFDLKKVPPEVIDRARVAFIDTIGVSVAGSHEEVAHIVAEMVKAEGSAPQCTVIGQSFRASPQLAALANGVSNHAMDYDFTFLNGQSVAAVIPALLPVAEVTKATPADVLGAFIVGCEVAARINRSSLRMGNDGGWHITGIVGVIAAAAACCKALEAAGRAGRQRHRHGRFVVGGYRGQLRHHDQAFALRQRGAQWRDGGDAGEQGLHLACLGVRRQQRVLLKLRPGAADRFRAVRRSRQTLGPGRDRLPDQVLPLRRPRPHCDRSGADAAR